MKKLKPYWLLILLFGFLSNAVYSQFSVSEPDYFDWKETFELTSTHQYFYDEDVIDNIPEDAMFWIDIQPEMNRIQRTTIAANGHSVFERYHTLEHKVNGKDLEFGLADMVKANGKVMVSLISSPDLYEEDSNSSTYKYNEELNELFSEPVDYDVIQENLIQEGWLLHSHSGTNWYRSEQAGVEVSFDALNHIVKTNYLDEGTKEITKYSEVHPGIWRTTMQMEIVLIQTIEGHCIEKRITKQYDNYNFEIRDNKPLFQSANSISPMKGELKLVQTNGNIRVELSKNEEAGDLYIFDVMGRLVFTNENFKNGYTEFDPSQTGIYFVEFVQKGIPHVEKIYFNNNKN